MNLTIKDIPKEERPIERLIQNGPKFLSNEELLAILLKTGTKNISSKVLATSILKEIDTIQNLKQITLPKLLQMEGIGYVKAATILATVELANRMNHAPLEIIFTKFQSAESVYHYYKSRLTEEKQEQFYALYLDNQKKILREKLLFIGTLNYSMVHPREIFKEALLVSAAFIICVHNHPSGDVTPSKEDLRLTQKLKELGLLLNLPILDHIIIGETYYSFYENENI